MAFMAFMGLYVTFTARGGWAGAVNCRCSHVSYLALLREVHSGGSWIAISRVSYESRGNQIVNRTFRARFYQLRCKDNRSELCTSPVA